MYIDIFVCARRRGQNAAVCLVDGVGGGGGARATVAARNFGSIIERSGDRKIPALFRARRAEWGELTSYWPRAQSPS